MDIIEFIYIPIILLLYFRTWKYNYLIDDPVPRDGYLYELSRKVDPSWYDRRRPIMSVVTNIGIFMAACGYIHLIFGWKAALLFAVMPLNVSGVSWITGNYYMSSVLLVLAAWMGLIGLDYVYGFDYVYVYGFDHLLREVYASVLSPLFFAAALNSTLSSAPFMAISLFLPYGWTLIAPFLFFFFGKRLRTGLRLRKEKQHAQGFTTIGTWQCGNLLHVPKLLAYYLYLSLWPYKLGFFHTYGKQDFYKKHWFLAATCIGLVAAVVTGTRINGFYTLCWLLSIGIFSQFIVYGQHMSERYTYLANVFFCVLLSIAIVDERIFWVVSTLFFCRSLAYIPAWKDDASLFSYSVTQFPACPENYVNLGSYYIARDNWLNAIKPMVAAERLTVGNKYGIYINLANCYAKSGLMGRGIEYLDKAIKIAPLDKIKELLTQKADLEDRIAIVNKNKKILEKIGAI